MGLIAASAAVMGIPGAIGLAIRDLRRASSQSQATRN
jgi:hypothetical protein